MEQNSLFERLGGAPVIEKVIVRLEEKIKADPVIGPFHKNVDFQKLNEQRKIYFTKLFGGAADYKGKNLSEAHKSLDLKDAHFDLFITVFKDSLAEQNISQELINETIQKLETTRREIVSRPSLFEELGGFEAIDKALTRLQEKILADPTLAPYHANVDFKKLNENRRLFFASVFGGPQQYAGKDLKAAHSSLKISDESFNIFLKYLRQAFLEIGTRERFVNKALRILELARDEVLGKKSVFERLGGEATLLEIVTRFHENLLQDHVLGPFYQKADRQRAIKGYTHYFTYLFGGFGIQDSTNLRVFHSSYKLTDVQYDLFVKIFNQTLASFKLDKEIIEEATQLIESRRDEVLERQSLWTRLGGEEVIDKVVGRFIEKIVNEPTLKQAHQHVDLKKYHENHKDFFAQIYGGYHIYAGKNLKEVHGPLQLKDEHFNIFTKLFKQTLVEFDVKEEVIAEALEVIELKRNEILNRTSLYERLGGEQGIELLVEKLNNNLANDPVLGPFHKEVDWTKLHQHRKQFFIQEFGGLNVYAGDIRTAHSSYKLNDEQFNLFIKLFKSTLVELNTKEDLVQEAIAHLETKRREILNQTPLFEKLGGIDGLDKFVHNLDKKIVADPRFAKFFEKTDLNKLHNHQFQFFLNLFGGRDVTYQGKSLRSAHATLPLSDDHFKGFLGHVQESLNELGTEKPIIEEVIKVFESTRNEILNQ
jgi:hemoglobin